MAELILDGGVLHYLSTSDHLPIFVEIRSANQCDQAPGSPATKEPFLKWNQLLKVHFNQLLLSTTPSADPEHFLSTIWSCASALGMQRTRRSAPPATQPWFNFSCTCFKRCLHSALNAVRKNGYTDESLRNYLFLKHQYKRVVIHFKNAHFADLSDQLINAENSSSFWSAIRKLSPTAGGGGCAALNLSSVSSHFHSLFNSSPSPRADLIADCHVVESLDRDFSLMELDSALLACKSGKAPGCDGVPYEFLINLNVINRCRLLDCLNTILHSERLPTSWSQLKMFLLFKKGDPAEVVNYRGISLLNGCTKLFTALLARRIYSWAEEHLLLPECQAGFRSSRGCLDNFFILQTAIH